MRRAWIEIWKKAHSRFAQTVALHAESVDRNGFCCRMLCCMLCVALHAESVDRNDNLKKALQDKHMSLSMRRAWIEIHMQ